MKITRKIIAISLSLLLVGGNMAFAQTKRSPKGALKPQISRAAAKAAQQREEPYSVLLMRQIHRKAIDAEKARRKKNNFMGKVGTLMVTASAGIEMAEISTATTGAAVATAAGVSAASVVGGCLVVAGFILVCGASAKEIIRRYWAQNSFPEKFVEIRRHLGFDILDRFSLVVENATPKLMQEDVIEALKQFVAHPRRRYQATELVNGEYRFYFMPSCKDVYVDINAEDRIIYVKEKSAPKQQYESIKVIGPKYVSL